MHANESRSTTQFIRTALDILEQEGPMTFRQLFWRLVSAGKIGNDAEHYDWLRQTMTRLCGPSGLIVDRDAFTIDGN
jgi:hypothetical protein